MDIEPTLVEAEWTFNRDEQQSEFHRVWRYEDEKQARWAVGRIEEELSVQSLQGVDMTENVEQEGSKMAVTIASEWRPEMDEHVLLGQVTRIINDLYDVVGRIDRDEAEDIAWFLYQEVSEQEVESSGVNNG